MTENVWHTDRMLILIFSGVFFALDVCGTSFVKNDLVYIENDIVELPSAKKQLTLILTVVDDEAKVNVKTNLTFWDDFVYDDKGHKAMLEKLSKCSQFIDVALCNDRQERDSCSCRCHFFHDKPDESEHIWLWVPGNCILAQEFVSRSSRRDSFDEYCFARYRKFTRPAEIDWLGDKQAGDICECTRLP